LGQACGGGRRSGQAIHRKSARSIDVGLRRYGAQNGPSAVTVKRGCTCGPVRCAEGEALPECQAMVGGLGGATGLPSASRLSCLCGVSLSWSSGRARTAQSGGPGTFVRYGRALFRSTRSAVACHGRRDATSTQDVGMGSINSVAAAGSGYSSAKGGTGLARARVPGRWY